MSFFQHHMHKHHTLTEVIPLIILLFTTVLYTLYLTPSSFIHIAGFVILSALSVSYFLFLINTRLLVFGVGFGLFEAVTIAVGFDILNTIVLVCVVMIVYLYSTRAS